MATGILQISSAITPIKSEQQDEAIMSTAELARKQKRREGQAQKAEKSRHRASVACASCRYRRIRCAVPEGETICTQCKRSGVECIIKNDDERRRPISRAYVCSLTERITLLETMLKERGIVVPLANLPAKTRRSPPRDVQLPNNHQAEERSQREELTSPGSSQSTHADVNDTDFDDCQIISHAPVPAPQSPNDTLEASLHKKRKLDLLLPEEGVINNCPVDSPPHVINLDIPLEPLTASYSSDADSEPSDSLSLLTPRSETSSWSTLGDSISTSVIIPSTTALCPSVTQNWWDDPDFVWTDSPPHISMPAISEVGNVINIDLPSQNDASSTSWGREWQAGSVVGVKGGLEETQSSQFAWVKFRRSLHGKD